MHTSFKAFGNAIYVCTGLSVDVATIVGIIIIVAIAMMGGMRSVALTDAMSAIFIVFCMIAALVAVFVGNGGIAGVLERTAEGTTAFPFGNYGFLGWAALTFGGTMNIIGDQNFIQRMASGKDNKSLKYAIYIFVAIIFAVMFCSSTLGFALRTVFPRRNKRPFILYIRRRLLILLSVVSCLAVVLLLYLQLVTHIFFLLQQAVLWISGADSLIKMLQNQEKFGTSVFAL